jgi:choline-glycine betaine transporter
MINLFNMDDHMVVFNRKMLRQQGCVLTVSVLLLIWNGYSAFHHQSVISAIGFGCFLINVLWTLLFYLDLYSDYKLEKHRYGLMKELRDKHQFDESLKHLESTQQRYDSMIKELIERQNNVRPE